MLMHAPLFVTVRAWPVPIVIFPPPLIVRLAMVSAEPCVKLPLLLMTTVPNGPAPDHGPEPFSVSVGLPPPLGVAKFVTVRPPPIVTLLEALAFTVALPETWPPTDRMLLPV